jgi:GAF domain-containing protein/HAMP domain-containing protein
MNLPNMGFPVSIRTKILALLLGMATFGLITIAIIAVQSAQTAGQSAKQISGQILRKQAEDSLLQLTQGSARENDLLLDKISQEADEMASYLANIYTESPYYHNPTNWLAKEHMTLGPDGQFMNGGNDPSSVFVPTTTEIDQVVIRDIEISAYLDLIFEPTFKGNPTVEAIYFATSHDVVRYYPNINLGAVLPPDFQATERIWYAGTLKRGAEHQEPWWTPAYLDATGLGIVTTAAAPVFDKQNELIGVVGFDVTLTGMKSAIEDREFLPGSYSFLIDDTGRAIALPEQGYQDILGRPPNAEEFGTDLTHVNTAFEPIIQSMLAGASQFTTIDIEGKELFIAYAPMESANWSLASVVETNEIVNSLSTLGKSMDLTTRSLILRRIIPISGLVFVVIILLGLILTDQMVAPIQKLAAATKEITSGNWEVNLPATRNDEIGSLAGSFRKMIEQLHELVSQLEQRVTERTKELEQRAVQLQAAADVGHAAVSLRNLDDLLGQVTQLISERFGFYHIGIFLLDEASEFAILRAANSPGGYQMLTHGHKLRIGHQGIVGYVTGKKKPRIALDVGEDAVHFQNPYLPETRSEMALPLIAGGDLLGVIDVQSKVPSAFHQDDIEVLQVLANQIAIAIQNAQLFQNLQDSLRETRNLYKIHSQKSWSNISDKKITSTYRYDRLQVASEEKIALEPEIIEQLNHGQIVLQENGFSSDPMLKLYAPIMMHGEAIGFIGFHSDDPTTNWGKDELALIRTITGQVALTLENARLLEETQLRAQREKTISEVTARMRETLNIDTVLHTAVQEIGEVLGLRQVTIRLHPDSKESQMQEFKDKLQEL